MASNRRQPTVLPKYPHFFKIIVPHTIGSGKLMIPKMFVSKYGKTLSDSVVYLKVPNGQVWQIDVTRKHGEVSLHGRWTRFVEHYSLDLGYLLVFGHQGNSTFSVVIFDKSASEIQYPACNIHGQELIASPKTEPCNKNHISHDFVPITWCQKRKETEKVVQVPPSKRARLDKSNQVLHHSVQDAEAHRRSQYEMFATMTSAEKARALEKCGSFESNSPYFKVVMQPTYAHDYFLGVPVDFAEKYFPGRKGHARLRTSDGRAWSVLYDQRLVRNNRRQARLCCGWRAFAKDNALEVGDVCVLELKDPTDISFQVVIFRHTISFSQADTSSVADRAKMKEPKMEGSETDVYRSDAHSPGQRKIVKGKSKKLKRKVPVRGHVMKLLSSGSEVPRALQEANNFVTEHPRFMIFMSSGYTRSPTMGVPTIFVNKYLKKSVKFATRTSSYGKRAAQVTLHVADRLWNVNLILYRSGSGKLSGGWLEFARGNNLGLGDACVFELINIPDVVMNVTIFRCV